MKKPVITIESLDKKFDLFLVKLDQRFEKIDQRFDTLEQKVEDNTSSIQFLIEHAVTREELRPIIKEEIVARLIPMESRLIGAIDAMMGKHRTFEEEVLAGRYRQEQLDHRVGVLEQMVGVSNVS